MQSKKSNIIKTKVYKTAHVIYDMGGGHGGGTTNPPDTSTQPPTGGKTK